MGGTRQVQKTRNAEVLTKTAISQRQSLESVQILLHGGLSSLTYLRGLFSESYYGDQALEMSNHFSYRDYADGKGLKDQKRIKKPHTALKVLHRGRSKRVNVFLDWLERGAFPAISEGRLQALQICVHADPNDREKVVETYTFTIKYHTNAEGKQVAAVEMNSPGGTAVTVEANNCGLQNLLREIMDLCQSLPDLPEERYIGMTLFCSQQDGSRYQVEGFKDAPSDRLFFAQRDGWEKRTEQVGPLQSIFHSTGLRVSYLHQPDLGGPSLIIEPPPLSSSDLRYPEATTIGFDIDAHDTPVGATDKDAGAAERTIDQTPSTTVDRNTRMTSPVSASVAARKQGENAALAAVRHSSAHKSLETQSSIMPVMKNALQGMMQQERLTQGDTQTQVPLRPPRAVQKAAWELSRQAYLPAPRNKVPSGAEKMLLLHSVAQELRQQKARLRKTSLEFAKPQGRTGAIMLCQCGHQEKGGATVECLYCGTWQHLSCYGFSGNQDPRLSEQDHTCYQCLLVNRDDHAFKKLRDLALKRRLMFFALQNGLRRKGDMATYLGVPIKTVDTVLKYLREKGHIKATSGSHKPNFARTGKPMFVPIRSGSAFEDMIQDLFNPRLHVESYYTELSDQTAAVGRQLMSMMPTDFPASASLKGSRKATPTTASGSDLRGSSMSNPSPPRADKNPLKRHRNGNDSVFETPAKRPAVNAFTSQRLRTIHSSFVLDANGEVSPMV